MRCPLCDNINYATFASDKKREFLHCKVCDLVFVPSQYHLAPYEEKQRYDRHQNDILDKGYRNFLMQIVSPLLMFLKKEDVGLDFGSGPKPALQSLFREHGFNVVLYDPFYKNDVGVLNNTYNFITATEVIEHVFQPRLIFDNIVRMMEPGALLGIMTKTYPLKNFINWWYKNDLTHVCFYSDKSFNWLAEYWHLSIKYQHGDVVVFEKK